MGNETASRTNSPGRAIPGLWVLALLMVLLPAVGVQAAGSLASSQGGSNGIIVSNAVTPPGSTVLVPVTLSAATDIAGVNIRVEYDPRAFSSPSVVRGSLLENTHLLFWDSPEAGRLCALAYSYDASPFTALTGTAFSLSLAVDNSVPDGDYLVSFVTDESGVFPSSGLTDLAGSRLPHTQTGGTITVDSSAQTEVPYDIDRNGIVDAADLLLFCSDWIHSPGAARSNFDQTGEVDKQDLFLFSEWWLYDYR